MMGFEDESSAQSLKEKVRSSNCLSSCFRGCTNAGDEEDEGRRSSSLIQSSSAWLCQAIPEVKERCRFLVSRIKKHRRCGEFSYDPLSYALNFDDGFEDDDTDKHRNFSSSLHLPPTPPPPPTVAAVGVA